MKKNLTINSNSVLGCYVLECFTFHPQKKNTRRTAHKNSFSRGKHKVDTKLFLLRDKYFFEGLTNCMPVKV